MVLICLMNIAVINQAELSDTHVQLLMNDTTTTPKDTTASAPVNWKVALHQLKLKECIIQYATSC